MTMTPPQIDPTEPTRGNLTRRTVVTTAVWSAPVIAAAVATPLAAASNTPTMTFTSSPPDVKNCVAFTPLTLHATTNGTLAAAGAQVTITIPPLLSFSDTTAKTKTVTLDANGNATLTFKPNPLAGVYTVDATWPAQGLTAQATLTVTDTFAGANTKLANAGNTVLIGSVPPTATLLGSNYYLDGTNLWYQSAIIATVNPADISTYSPGYAGQFDAISYRNGNTWYSSYNGTWGGATYANVPPTAKALAWFYFLDGTNLWFNNAIIATGVTAAFAYPINNNSGCDYIAGGKLYRLIGASPSPWPIPPVPTTLLGALYSISATGTLYYQDTVVSTTVTEHGDGWSDGYNYFIDYRDASGYHTADVGTVAFTWTPPAGSKLLGMNYFLAPNNDLWYQNRQIDSGILDAYAFDRNNSNQLSYTTGVCP